MIVKGREGVDRKIPINNVYPDSRLALAMVLVGCASAVIVVLGIPCVLPQGTRVERWVASRRLLGGRISWS